MDDRDDKKVVQEWVENHSRIEFQKPPKGIYNIFVEGAIGEGKSTLCTMLKSMLQSKKDCHVIENDEKVDEELLHLFYQNPKEMEVLLQNGMAIARAMSRIRSFKRVSEIRQTSNKPIFIINDTGFLTNEAFIAANLYADHISKITMVALMDMLYNLEVSVAQSIYRPTHVILIHSDIERCMSNIRSRGRKAEESLESSYNDQLLRAYSEVYDIKKRKAPENVTFMKSKFNNSLQLPREIVDMFSGS
jgi:deoxyadenosine/deoxycytidine kinase